MLALVVTLLAAAPVQGRFLLEVSGLPVAELRVSVRGQRYVYEATHFLEEGPREHRTELTLTPTTPMPEVLALLRRPAPGCRDVLEERSGRTEELCVTAGASTKVSGTLDGTAFEADYELTGALARISVGAAHWVAVTRPSRPPLESPFVRGVAVPTGATKLSPPFPGARWLAHAPEGIGAEDRVGRARCLVLAREAQARRPGARLSVGLVVEGDRAYPHAWLTEGEAATDPSVLPGDPVLSSRRYLEVPAAQSGTFFLQLFDGALRLEAK